MLRKSNGEKSLNYTQLSPGVKYKISHLPVHERCRQVEEFTHYITHMQWAITGNELQEKTRLQLPLLTQHVPHRNMNHIKLPLKYFFIIWGLNQMTEDSYGALEFNAPFSRNISQLVSINNAIISLTTKSLNSFPGAGKLGYSSKKYAKPLSCTS